MFNSKKEEEQGKIEKAKAFVKRMLDKVDSIPMDKTSNRILAEDLTRNCIELFKLLSAAEKPPEESDEKTMYSLIANELLRSRPYLMILELRAGAKIGTSTIADLDTLIIALLTREETDKKTSEP